MAKRIVVLLFAVFFLNGFAAAKEAPPAADDPVLEQRLMKLSSKLRCLVCQNETLADSHAELAVDLRKEIRENMKSGMSDDEIRKWLVSRYGDFVLYEPPFKPTTFLLWVGPFLLLVVGLAVLYINLRRRQKMQVEPEQDGADLALSRSLLNENQDNSQP
ncbi:MAG: cytochrome c-type biogenesis protein [Thiobacillaceae bacterium]|jgi:cytochrome c-type biogenesis protein CcmH